MRVYLVRHGQTTADIEGRYGGEYDDELTGLGVEQANKLAEKLIDKNIQIIYHSPKIRAIETANILENKLECSKVEIYNLKERNGYGVITGLTEEEAKEQYLDEYNNFVEQGYSYHIKESEQYDDFKQRFTNVFDKILSESKHEKIAIVSHGGLIRGFVREIMKLGELKKLSDCAIIEFEYINGKIKLISLDNAELV